MVSKEKERLQSSPGQDIHPWKKWGPYVSEREWGAVREDYSANGDAWNFITHDKARSQAYRWGEDGLAGFCDYFQTWAFSLGFWNGKDPILKERLFGLNPYEGNHGEDVKEYYFYLDATPTHSYMKFLYKYPQEAFPYDQLVKENQKRGTKDREFELMDTGIFNEGRYYDVFVEYAKAGPHDLCIKIEIVNRGPDTASLHVLPQLLFRNRWSWKQQLDQIPEIREESSVLYADPSKLPSILGVPYEYSVDPVYLYADPGAKLLFTNNESNNERLYNSPNRTPYVKDAFHRHIINGEKCLNPDQKGTKAAFHYEITIPSKSSHVLHLRLTTSKMKNPLADVETIISERKREADEFYEEIQGPLLSTEDKAIQRQCWASLLWSKQYYHYNVERWFEGDNPKVPPPSSRQNIRNDHWNWLNANGVISMPDKWEYPWFAAWDLAFHTIAFAHIDIDFAKNQLHLLLHHQYQHSNGQIPAYEWEFSDLNPPVQAWAAMRLFEIDGEKDLDFLEVCFLKLTRNFSWWVNKVDKLGNNFFEGGFLGLDNISIIDRSKPLPGGGYFEESDGTGWMGFFALAMMRMALVLAHRTSVYEEMATVYFEYFAYIAHAMQGTKARPTDMWSEEDGFFYDVISHPVGTHHQLKIRSFVGIIPFFSLEFLEEEKMKQHPGFYRNFRLFLKEHPKLCKRFITPIEDKKGYLLSLMNVSQMQRIFQKVWNPEEFLSSYGLRSLSKFHEKNPLVFEGRSVSYEPGESLERMKGGNSNWRGPIWFPTNFLTLESLVLLNKALGSSFSIKTDKGSVSLQEAASLLRNGLIDLFRKNSDKKRPVHGDYTLFQTDPHWKDLLLFYEHYHGDNGRGLGASHQTGWSALVATLIAELKS